MQRRVPGSMWALAWLVGCVIVASQPSVAHAGCLNPCELSVEPMTVEPPLECANLNALPQDCDCGVVFGLTNNCTAAIEAVEFSFRFCSDATGVERGCVSVNPGVRASLEIQLPELGRLESSFRVRSSGREHQVRITSNVHSFDVGGCSMRRVGLGSPWPATASGTALVSVWLAIRRRHRQLSSVPRPGQH